MRDWFKAELVGMMGFLEAAELGLLRSAKGWMFLHDCKYWDIRTDARCLLSPNARVFTWNIHTIWLHFHFHVLLHTTVTINKQQIFFFQFRDICVCLLKNWCIPTSVSWRFSLDLGDQPPGRFSFLLEADLDFRRHFPAPERLRSSVPESLQWCELAYL